MVHIKPDVFWLQHLQSAVVTICHVLSDFCTKDTKWDLCSSSQQLAQAEKVKQGKLDRTRMTTFALKHEGRKRGFVFVQSAASSGRKVPLDRTSLPASS